MKALLTSLFFIPFIITTGYSQVDMPGLYYRNIGPANQGGRIVDIEAHGDDFTKVYVATGSGGVWKSQNAGTTWEPIFDDYETASIGDIALDPSDHTTLWVGTGEANNRNSVSWGNGMYVSRDGGETFEHKGLSSTHTIARVLVHPDDGDEVCACSTGHLWGYSGDRGLFRTKDGGETWSKLTNGLPNDGKTGCTDLVRDPNNPNTLYAAFYHRLREPWHFHSGGEQGGIFKSTDNGKSWKKLTNGLPSGPTGRIGLAIYQSNPEIVMALVEAEKSESLDTPGSGVYRTEDGGLTWSYVNTYNNRPFYYSQIRINPADDQRVYLLTTRFMVSEDGGKTLTNGSPDYEVHGDYHALWFDPNYPDRYYLGADKGLSITHDHGKRFQLIDNLPIAQYYRINYDMRDPYYVYGGLQDNGSYATASFSRDARGILSDSNWKMHWGDGQDAAANPNDHTDMYSSMENGSYFKYNPDTREISRISPFAVNTINYWEYFNKKEEDKASASRFNWSAPLMMSPHDPTHIYVAGNHVYRSTDRGTTWKIISPDLSTNHPEKRKEGNSGGVTPDNTGAETHCAVYSLAISPITEDILWAGTDDSQIHVTTDGGANWTNVRANLTGVPEDIWVSRVEASRFESGRAYVTFDGHRSDNFETYVYRTDDYGKTWDKITNGFTNSETARVIREDVKNPNLLFVGTETGVWYSINRGEKWSRLKLNMPTVSVYDLKIHPRDNDLIVGTHGRSAWILDDISPLQDLGLAQKDPFHLYDQKVATIWNNISRGGQRGHFWFAGDNPKTVQTYSNIPRAQFKSAAAITYLINNTSTDSLTMTITSMDGARKREMKVPAEQGINRIYWNREFDATPYTDEEEEYLTTMLKDLADYTANRRVVAAYDRFTNADTPLRKREIITPLTQGYLSFNIDPSLLVETAEPGTYKVSLSDGNHTTQTTLTIRDDPMNGG